MDPVYNYKEDAALSNGWKDTFDMFERYGLYGKKDPVGYKSVSLWKRTNLSILALFFGPLYFLYLRMYRIALSSLLFILGIILALVIVDTVLGTSIADFWTSTASGLIYSMISNYAYYNYKVKGYRGWNPFYGYMSSAA